MKSLSFFCTDGRTQPQVRSPNIKLISTTPLSEPSEQAELGLLLQAEVRALSHGSVKVRSPASSRNNSHFFYWTTPCPTTSEERALSSHSSTEWNAQYTTPALSTYEAYEDIYLLKFIYGHKTQDPPNHLLHIILNDTKIIIFRQY